MYRHVYLWIIVLKKKLPKLHYLYLIVGDESLSLLCLMDGWMNQAYSRLSTTHGHITDCKLLCMYGTRLVLVRPAASFYSASPLKHHATGKQWCPNPDHYSDSGPPRRSLTLLCWALSRAAEPQILTSFVWRSRGSNHQPPACQANAQPLHYPAAVVCIVAWSVWNPCLHRGVPDLFGLPAPVYAKTVTHLLPCLGKRSLVYRGSLPCTGGLPDYIPGAFDTNARLSVGWKCDARHVQWPSGWAIPVLPLGRARDLPSGLSSFEGCRTGLFQAFTLLTMHVEIAQTYEAFSIQRPNGHL